MALVPRFGLRIRQTEDLNKVGRGAIRGEGFGAVDDVFPLHGNGPGGDGGNVAAGIGFRDCCRGNGLPLHQWRK